MTLGPVSNTWMMQSVKTVDPLVETADFAADIAIGDGVSFRTVNIDNSSLFHGNPETTGVWAIKWAGSVYG